MPPVVAAAGIGAAGMLGGAALSASGSKSGAEIAANAQQHAADLQSQSAQQALAFEQQQATQAQQNYNTTTAFNRGVYTDQQQRLAPYRALGAGSLAQLSQPIPKGGQ